MQEGFSLVPFVFLMCTAMWSYWQENIRNHSILICYCYCLSAIIFILKVLKNLGQVAILCTEEEMLVALLATE